MMRFGCLMWCCLLFSNLLLAQTDSTLFKVMSYNVENCFDTIDNPEVEDEEFLPESNRHWTEGRFDLKLQHLSQVISFMCGEKWNHQTHWMSSFATCRPGRAGSWRAARNVWLLPIV